MNQKQKDLLCKMVNGKATKIKEQLSNGIFCVNRYNFQSSVQESSENFDLLMPSQKKTAIRLLAREEKMKAEERKLRNEWTEFRESVEKSNEALQTNKDAAINDLNIAVEKAILEVQFAENAEQAKAVVDSLPTAESLLP